MIKAGRLLLVTRGEYSDHEIIGFFVVLDNFDPMKKLEEYIIKHPEQKKEYKFDEDSYFATLTKEGLLLEIDYSNLHLGDCSTYTEAEFTP